MRSTSVQFLAQIRLNLNNIDQFLSIACSLADDNIISDSKLRDGVYEAAKEVRSSALLIDHLRNLFSHQQSIEDLQEKQKYQLASSQDVAFSLPIYQHKQQTSSRSTLRQFTYSNHQTLVRAAKCLVANIAKILYLTDSLVLRDLGFDQGSNYEGHETSSRQPEVSDRLDNVANYSQMLRSFGELSIELVDLGQCIMMYKLGSGSGFGSNLSANFELGQCGPSGHAHPARRASQQHCCAELSSSGNGGAGLSLMRPSSSSNSMLQDCAARYQNFGGPVLGFELGAGAQTTTTTRQLSIWNEEEPQQPAVMDTINELDVTNRQRKSQVTPAATSGAWCKFSSSLLEHQTNDERAKIEVQLQDMQILFQVNRLIIDRSILLMLSASKCCLRQGDECYRGLEARRSIVIQIRASISIILAIVKCAVFDSTQPSSVGPTQTTGNNNNNLIQTSPSALILDEPTNSSTQRKDNQFEQHHYQARSSPGQIIQCLSGSLQFRAGARASNNPNATNKRPHQLQLRHDFNSALLNEHRDEPICFQSPNNLRSRLNELEDFNGLPSQKLPLQIMNYFLLTWQGSQSVHDAINKMQILVEPFVHVTDYKYLIQLLNDTFVAHQRASQTASSLPASSGALYSGQGAPFEDWLTNEYEIEENNNNNKENTCMSGNDKVGVNNPAHRFGSSFDFQLTGGFLLMNKRQLVNALNVVFLGEIKGNLVERIQEFTDCAYTKHEHRESILLLLHCIKLQLNKFVKTIYKLRRRGSALTELSLGQLRQLASQLTDTCAELKHELQTSVIEQSDELDRNNAQLDLVKQIKHFSLVGDVAKTNRACSLFMEQTEQLIELCKMLNQVSPTHKMKISTKSMAIWFHSNVKQLLSSAQSLSQNPRSRVLKDCTWAYLQVWCSFYDDFCQVARQLAYLNHAHYDSGRAARVASMRDQILIRRRLQAAAAASASLAAAAAAGCVTYSEEEAAVAASETDEFDATAILAPTGNSSASAACCSRSVEGRYRPTSTETDEFVLHFKGRQNRQSISARTLNRTDSVQSLVNVAGPIPDNFSDTDSPRSLDHYYGFGAHYQQRSRHPPVNLCAGYPAYVAPGAGGAQVSAYADQNEYLQQPISYAPYASDVIVPRRHAHVVQAQIPRASLRDQYQAEPKRRDELPAPPGQRQRRRQNKQKQEQAGHSTLEEESEDGIGGLEPELEESSRRRRPVENATAAAAAASETANNTDQQSSTTEPDKWSDSDADAIVRGARETAQMALSMYQFTKGEGDLNTTQDLFTQAELFAEEANELYKEVRCFSYKVPTGDLKKELLAQLGSIPALVQQLQFIVKNPTVGTPATFAKVDSVIRETRSLMEAVNRVVTATLSCRQHYNMAIASMRKRTRTLSPSYRADKGFEFDNHTSARQSTIGGRHGAGGGGMGSEPDI